MSSAYNSKLLSIQYEEVRAAGAHRATRELLWQNRRFIELDLWHTVQHWKKSTPQKHRKPPRSSQQAASRKQRATKIVNVFSTPFAAGATWKRRSIPLACLSR